MKAMTKKTARIYNCTFKDSEGKEVIGLVVCRDEDKLKQASNLISYERTRLRKVDDRVKWAVIKHKHYGYRITVKVTGAGIYI